MAGLRNCPPDIEAAPSMTCVAVLIEFPTVSGGENSLFALLDALRRRGDALAPLLLAPGAGAFAERARALGLALRPYELRADGRRRAFAAVAEDLAPILREEGAALVHANSLSAAEYSGLIGEQSGIPATGHVRDIQKLKRSRVARLAKNQRLIAVSEATRRHLVAQGLEDQRCVAVHNGVDSDFGAGLTPASPLRPAGSPEPTATVAMIGQICLRKAQDLGLEAMVPLLRERPGLELLVIGERFSAKAESIAFETALHDRAGSAGVAGRVRFLGYRDDVAAILRGTTLLLHPAHQEPLGRVLLEAQSAGVPVVARRIGGNAEVVQHGETGLLTGDSPEALRDALASLLDDEERRSAMGRRAQRRMAAKFTPEQCAAGVAEVWSAVLRDAS